MSAQPTVLKQGRLRYGRQRAHCGSCGSEGMAQHLSQPSRHACSAPLPTWAACRKGCRGGSGMPPGAGPGARPGAGGARPGAGGAR